MAPWDMGTYFDTLSSKLAIYESEYHQLQDAAFLLELALWKSKIDESMAMQNDTAHTKWQCRINCGADVIIPNVLPFLIADEKKDNGNDEDESMDSHNIDFSSDEEDNIPLPALGNNLFGSSSSGEMSMDESSDTGSF